MNNVNFYLETSALGYFLSFMRGVDAQATHELQNSKNREWYISTTTLWEFMLINDFKDYDHYLFLASLLVSKKILKSPSEIILNYLVTENKEEQKTSDIFSNSKIAKCWERTCDDRSYTFNIMNTPIIDMTKKIKNISKNIPFIIGLHDNDTDETIKGIRELIEYFYTIQFNDEVTVQIQHLRKISILVCFLLVCCGYDITYDVIDEYWNQINITDIIMRYEYIINKKPEIINSGPSWFIANVIYSQSYQKNKNSRGALHDGFHMSCPR